MPTTIIKDASIVVTMDNARRELKKTDIRIADGVIVEIGTNLSFSNHDVLLLLLCFHRGALISRSAAINQDIVELFFMCVI